LDWKGSGEAFGRANPVVVVVVVGVGVAVVVGGSAVPVVVVGALVAVNVCCAAGVVVDVVIVAAAADGVEAPRCDRTERTPGVITAARTTKQTATMVKRCLRTARWSEGQRTTQWSYGSRARSSKPSSSDSTVG
jgi:hypothetical protein